MSRALIVIDVQESFRRLPEWRQVSNPDIVADVQRLVDGARARGHEVIWVLHTHPETAPAEPGSVDPFLPSNGFVRLIDGLEPAAGELVLYKTSRNAFTTTGLARHLTAQGIEQLVICGIQTEECCETTTRVAGDMGYRVTFVSEATATFPIVRPDTGAVLGTDAVIARTEFVLAGRFARIATIDDAFADGEAPVSG
jgi:nicotinamidase-related amidase